VSMLFDTSPVDDQARAKTRRRRMEKAAEEPSFSPPALPERTGLLLPVGTIDHTYTCVYSPCQAQCHDICVEDEGDWLIRCCFCGTAQWVKAIKGHIKPKAEEFRFRDGIHQGLTIDEAAAQPRGRDYIEWAAKEHKRPAVKAACQTWLDTQAARP
jgi:hypothetical protein